MFYKTSCGRVKQLQKIWGLLEYTESHKLETFHHDSVDPHGFVKPDENKSPSDRVPKFGDGDYWPYIIKYYFDFNSWSKTLMEWLRTFDMTSDKFWFWILLNEMKESIFQMIGVKA